MQMWSEESLKKKMEILREAVRQEMWFKVWSLWLNSTEFTVAYWKMQLNYCMYPEKKKRKNKKKEKKRKVIVGIKHGYIVSKHLKCEGWNGSDIHSMVLPRLGVKMRFPSRPCQCGKKQEEESFRYLQYMNFRTICTVFIIWRFSEVFLISLSLILQEQNVCRQQWQWKILCATKISVGVYSTLWCRIASEKAVLCSLIGVLHCPAH